MILPWQRYKNFEISLKCILRDLAAIKNLSLFTQSIKKKHLVFTFYQCTGFQPCSQYWKLGTVDCWLSCENWNWKFPVGVSGLHRSTLPKNRKPHENSVICSFNLSWLNRFSHLRTATSRPQILALSQTFWLVSYSLVLYHFQLMRI